MLVDVSDVVQSLAEFTVSISRPAVPTFDAAGHKVAGSPTVTSASVVLQRPSTDVIQRLPEGVRADARWLMHTTADVRGAKDGTGGHLPDQVTYDGTTYTVVEFEGQTAHGLYRRVILMEGGG